MTTNRFLRKIVDIISRMRNSKKSEKYESGEINREFHGIWEISIAYTYKCEGIASTKAARGSNELPRSGATGSVC